METLVLNSSYMAIDRIDWREAVADLLTGRAEVVETYSDKYVHSGKTSRSNWPRHMEPLQTEETGVWRVPSIIRFLSKALFFRKFVKFSRHNVYLRDKGRCQYCGCKTSLNDFTYDHVMPQSRGGGTNWGNIVVACLSCNSKKANKTPSEAKMYLIQEPFRPMSLPGQVSPALRWKEGMPDSWKNFLASVGYWHAALDST